MDLFDRCAATNRLAAVPAAEKLAFALVVLVIAVAAPNPWVHGAIILTMPLLLVVVAGVARRDLALAASVPVGFVTLGGLAQLAVLDPSGEGAWLRFTNVDLALTTLLRSLAAVSALLFLALTTPLGAILDVLRRLRLPAVVIDVAALMLRLIRLLLVRVAEGRRAQAQRLGYVGYRRSLRSAGLLAATLLPHSLARAERLEMGLALRGYDGTLRHHPQPWQPNGRRLVAGSLLLLLFLTLALVPG